MRQLTSRPAGKMKVPKVSENAAGYQLSSPSSVTPKLRPMISSGAMDCARPARARNWAMQIMKMNAISCIGDMPMSGAASPSGSISSFSFPSDERDLAAAGPILPSLSLHVDCLSRDESAVVDAISDDSCLFSSARTKQLTKDHEGSIHQVSIEYWREEMEPHNVFGKCRA